MLTRRLLNLSKSFQGLILPQQPNVIYHFCRFSSITDEVKHLPKDSFKGHLNNNESNFKIPSEVQYLLDSKIQTINSKDIVTAVLSLSKMQADHKLSQNIQDKKFFKNLCKVINLHLDELQIHETVTILNELVKVNVPSSSKIISNILRHIDSLLMNSSLKYFVRVSEILYKMKPSPYTKAMSRSMDNKFLIKLSTDIDASDMELLVNAIIYINRNLNNNRILKIVLITLQSNNFENMTIPLAIHLLKSSMSRNTIPPELREILKKTKNFLAINIDQIDSTNLQSLLYGYLKVDESKRNGFYNKILFDNISQRIISCDTEFSVALENLQMFTVYRHLDKKLVNYAAAKYYEEKRIKVQDIRYEIEKLLSLITAFASVKFKPIFWEEIYETLNTEKILRFNCETLLVYAFNLSCLECYDSQVLKKIFNYNFPRSFHWTLMKLWQKLKTMPNYNGPQAPNTMIELFKELPRRYNFPLLATLEKGLGGSAFVKTNLRSKLFHQIDHVVVFRNNEYPVAINNESTGGTEREFIEDLQTPPNSQIISVMLVNRNFYSRNTKELIGTYSSYIESLEALSFPVVAINDENWSSLEETNKIPFLMQKIKSKLASY